MISYPASMSRASKRELKIPRLISAMRKASVVMHTYRENRKKMIAMEAGAEWSDNAADLPRPWNGIGLFRRVVLQALINTTPRCLLSTWRRDQKRAVRGAQDWSNRQFERINLGENLRRFYDDALHLMGVMKVGVTTPADAERTGWRTFTGEAFAQTVDFDDYNCDVQARNLEELTFEGHRYRASAEAINKMYRLKGDRKVTGDTLRSHNDDGDERVGVIGRGYRGGEYDEFGEMTDCWEYYLPTHRKILIFRSQGGKLPRGEDDLLETLEYVGPDRGPFVKLGFLWVPGNLFPRGPIMDLYPIDANANAMLRKVLRQAARFKQIDVYSGAAAKDMDNINNANDGESIKADKLSEIRQWQSSPPNPQLFGVAQAFMQIFNKLGGNIDTLGGLARQAGTASQEQMLNQNAAGMLGVLQRAAHRATQNVMDSLLWYFWNDPQGVMQSEYTLDSSKQVGVIREVYPAGAEGKEYTRDMPWEDLDVKVDPYSLVADTPQTKLQQMMSALNTLMPVLPLVQQSGLAPDWRFFFTKFAELTNNPDIADMLHLQDPGPQDANESPHDSTKPPVTSRTETRRSESEATEEGGVKDMMQQLMGAGMNGVGDYQSAEGYQ